MSVLQLTNVHGISIGKFNLKFDICYKFIRNTIFVLFLENNLLICETQLFIHVIVEWLTSESIYAGKFYSNPY